MIIYTQQKRVPFGPVFQGLVADPQAKHYRCMKHAVWLYLYLIAFSNLKTGKLITRLSDIARAMGLPEETLRSWLGHLRKWGYVTINKQGNQILFKITKWINITTELGAVTPEKTARKKTTRKATAQAALEEGAKGREVTEVTARQIAETLEESDSLSRIDDICRRYPQHIIQRSLRETKAVPADKIKKSRIALFVYLVKKYAQQENPPFGN